MIYRTIPTHEKTMVGNLIKFNLQAQIWEFAKCNRKKNPQGKRNLIQHALRKHKNQENIHQDCNLTKQEQRIMKVRIRTLQQETASARTQNKQDQPEQRKRNHTVQKPTSEQNIQYRPLGKGSTSATGSKKRTEMGMRDPGMHTCFAKHEIGRATSRKTTRIPNHTIRT